MNSRIQFKQLLWFRRHPVLPILILSCPLATGCFKQVATSEPIATEPLAEESTVAESDADAPTEESGISHAPARLTVSEIVVPAGLRPSEPVADLIRLIDAGAEDSLMMAFVTNSTGIYNLRAEEIVYLSDIGVPAPVLTAIIQHDHLLRLQPVETFESEPMVADANPQFANASGNEAALPEPTVSNVSLSEAPGTIRPGAPNFQSLNRAVPNGQLAASDDFHEALAPYGSWVDVEGYGNCWQPSVGRINQSWAPYFDHGRWVYSDCGWYWMSDYSWGWAAFHYGRWFQHVTLGWCWVPDRVWGPSWVCWRANEQFCGWAALPPGAQFHPGTGLSFHGVPAAPDCHFNLAADVFHFVPSGRLADPHPQHIAIPKPRLADVFHHSTPSANFTSHHGTVANQGLPGEHFVGAGHRPLVQVALHNSDPAGFQNIRDRLEGSTLAIQKLPEVKLATAPPRSSTDGGVVKTVTSVGRSHSDNRVATIPLQTAVNIRTHELASQRMNPEAGQNLQLTQAKLGPEAVNRPNALMRISPEALAGAERTLPQLPESRNRHWVVGTSEDRYTAVVHGLPAPAPQRLVQIRPGVFGSAANRPLAAPPTRSAISENRWWIPTGGKQVDPLMPSSRPINHQIGHGTLEHEPLRPLSLGEGRVQREAETIALVPRLVTPASASAVDHLPAQERASTSNDSHSKHSTGSASPTDHQTASESHAKAR